MAIHELFAYLRVDNANTAIEFYRDAFGATEKFRLSEPSGRIGHAELDFNGMTLMLSDEFPEYGMRGPNADNRGAVTLHLHVDNADVVLEQAVAAGAKLEMAAQDHFYGERSGSVIDPFGHRWSIGHSIEELSPTEMQRRYTELLQQ
jgi:uncharacterized glyoxalase superfamily protein PhnB